MRSAFLTICQPIATAKLIVRRGFGRPALALFPHVAALAIMLATEATATAMAAFALAWGILNFFWLALTRRPVLASVLSLSMMAVLVLLSQLKYQVLMMTANFVDLMIVDTDTISFLLTVFPALRWIVALSLIVLLFVTVTVWRLDPFRMRRSVAIALVVVCLGGLSALEMLFPMAPFEAFYGGNLVSSFAWGRSRRRAHRRPSRHTLFSFTMSPASTYAWRRGSRSRTVTARTSNHSTAKSAIF